MARSKGFPSRTLEPTGGILYSWIFQNKTVKLPRNHFWSFTIDFKRMKYEGMDVGPCMTIDWITLPIRRWQDLVGLNLKGRYGDRGIESTFYVWEHDYGEQFSLEVLKRRGRSFLVRMEMEVDFHGYAGTDRNRRLPVRAQTWLKYNGLTVPDVLDRLRPTMKQARLIAGQFMDMTVYGVPAARSRVFPPKP
jgi:hypothetical protein